MTRWNWIMLGGTAAVIVGALADNWTPILLGIVGVIVGVIGVVATPGGSP